MPRSVFWCFFVVDTAVSILMIFRFFGVDFGGFVPAILAGSLLTRTPIIALIATANYFFVRRMMSVKRHVNPYVWYSAGFAAGYVLILVVLSFLMNGVLFDREVFVRAHEGSHSWWAILGPYAVAYVASSAVYLGTRRKEAGVSASFN